MKKHKYLIIAIFAGSMLFSACEKDMDQPSSKIQQADEINTFIWESMHELYLWTENVPTLSNIYYASKKDSLNNFLNKFNDHEQLFEALLYDRENVDKFSWIVDDYEVLEKEFQGISKSMGFNFRPARYGTENNVLGYVRYVLKGSPADKAGLKRGDIFTKVDNQQLTLTNYWELLFNSESFTLSFADAVENSFIPNGRTANITAVELTENPIFLDTVYTVNNQKIGYLIYNSFTSTFDKQLNDVFLKFKNSGISKFILDLRYNGGGSLETTTYLASMIYGTQTSKVFLKTEYNDLLQNYFNQKYGAGYLNVNFESDITNANNTKTPIATLNLSDIYIITSDYTASASESIINGLMPYMNVITIGTPTYGKYVGSMTVKDYIDDKGTVNAKHKWALQPIVLKIANSAGISDFVTGLSPQITIAENARNLSVLGDLNEPLLKTAITAITGTTSKSASAPSQPGIENLKPIDTNHNTDMYFNKKQIIK